MNDEPRLGLPSASVFEILAECNGQQQLLKSLPPETIAEQKDIEDPLRDRGLRIHKARETGNTLELTLEETELYQSGLRYETRLLEKWKETFVIEKIQEGPRELRLWLHEPGNLDPICSGQLDVHFISGNRAHIIDWKTGFLSHLVGAPGNWQLRLQAVLLKWEYPQLTDIRVAFAKPMYEKSELDFADYSEMDLKYSHDAIIYLLWMSTQLDAPRRAGVHCRWCPCKTHCPEAFAYALLPSAYAKLEKKKIEPKDEVTPQDLYRLWEAGSAIRSILDAVVDRLKTWTDEELATIGIARGKPTPVLEWTDVKGAFEFLLNEKSWNEEGLWKCLSFVLGNLEQQIQREMSVGESEANEKVKKLLENFYTVKEGARRLKKLR